LQPGGRGIAILEVGALLLRIAALEAALEQQGLALGAGRQGAQELGGQARARVARAAAGIVLLQATLRVEADAGVERAVGALQQVEVPGADGCRPGERIIA
jgi:hypothetical protein